MTPVLILLTGITMRSVRLNGNRYDIVYYPTTTKDLFRLFSAFSLPCNVIKHRGRYEIIYPDKPSIAVTDCSRVDDMTLKQWYEFAVKHLPAGLQTGEEGILWENYIQKVKHSFA
jgi:hypothetical protein